MGYYGNNALTFIARKMRINMQQSRLFKMVGGGKMIYTISLTTRVIINTNLQTIKHDPSLVKPHATFQTDCNCHHMYHKLGSKVTAK